MTDCIFCKIINNEIPSKIIYEDDHAIAFLDISPSTNGHTLVIPKKHYATFSDLPEQEVGPFMQSVQKVCKGIDTYAQGYNIVQNNGKEAGQIVFHLHFHIIPRREGDGLVIGDWKTKLENPDLDKVRDELKEIFKKG
jgi:histidine triad (HIT) family protein